MPVSEKVTKAEDFVASAFRISMSDLSDIVNDHKLDQKDRKYAIELPDINTIDAPLEDLASLVARTSNAYGRIARIAGIARAQFKIAKGRYERKYKQSLEGRNAEERKQNAISLSESEHVAMTIAESIAEYADSLEIAARIASESARKIYDKVSSMSSASNRESHGYYSDSNFA